MLGASLYIIACSAKNRLRSRLRRLREPRYLIGAVVGAVYLYVTFFARLRAARANARRANAGRGAGPASVAALLAAGPTLAGLALMALAAAGWLVPLDSGLLDFSEAEMQLLFPAPVSRRQLLIHRLLRSQLGMLFGAIIIGFASGATLSGFSRLRLAVGAWVLLVIGKIYFTGVTLARTSLAGHDTRSRRIAWLPIAATVAALAVVVARLTRDYLRVAPGGVREILQLVSGVSQTGWARVALWPFMAIAAPLFATGPGTYLMALASALAVMLAIFAWVLKSDAAFQDAMADVVARRSQEPARQGAASYKLRAGGWRLAPTGRPEAAFAWKAAMQTLRLVDKRSLARAVAILILLTLIASSMGRANGLASSIGAFALAATVFAILVAPQVLRIDLREDLRHLELLKTWPVKASAVVRGELLWPGVLITALAWTMLAVAMFLSGTILTRVGVGWRMGGGTAIAILAPALIFSQLTIHNSVALLFPAWVPLGSQRPRGLDAMGQRLIMLGGTWFLLVLSALPGAIAGGIVWLALGRLVGPAALVPAAFVFTVIVGLEVLLATEAIGPAYERLDILAVERPE